MLLKNTKIPSWGVNSRMHPAPVFESKSRPAGIHPKRFQNTSECHRETDSTVHHQRFYGSTTSTEANVALAFLWYDVFMLRIQPTGREEIRKNERTELLSVLMKFAKA